MRMSILGATCLVFVVGLGGARGQDDPLLVVSPRVDLKWSATGRLLGWLGSGARVEKLGQQEDWVRVEVRGWLPTRSIETAGGGARVAPVEETLHVSPRGRVFGGLRGNEAVRPLRTVDDWSEVAIVGWLPEGSVAAAPESPSAATGEAPPASAGEAASDRPAIGRLAQRAELKGAPEGTAIAQLPAGTIVGTHETRGGWTRVTVQGWVPSAVVKAGGNGEVGPEIVAAAGPEIFVGRRMRWTVEYVALQRADRARTDLAPGELFALARVPDQAGLYVYLVVPERLAAAFRDLEPFAPVRVEGRVRIGRSALTGSPILDVERLLP